MNMINIPNITVPRSKNTASYTGRIPILYGRNTAQFNDRTVRISAPDIRTVSFDLSSKLSDSSGSIILDCHGKIVDIHIGAHHSRKAKSKETFFNKKNIQQICFNLFRTFIAEIILPHVNDDQTMKKWQLNSLFIFRI